MVRTLNEFISEVIGIVEPWSVSSVTLVEGEEVVNVELEYDREKRPDPPHCECGGECGYYDMVRKTWRHTDLCEYICNRLPTFFRQSPFWLILSVFHQHLYKKNRVFVLLI